ncbi:MAG: glycoside hydrolase family 2 TIM barrel-domain containing protein [Bacteroidota bacterium]|nr:glycoside hydrolase family 2 TIM barrel-domain containing protein [Bacteroidota bacterium]
MQHSDHILTQRTRRSAVFFVLLACFVVFPALSQPKFFEQRRALPTDLSMGILSPTAHRSVIDLNGTWEYRSKGDDKWSGVTVPSSFSGHHQVVFRREFNVSRAAAASSVFQLVALSISYYCEISINDQFVGKHAGLTSFNFKISPGVIRPGKNTITITVHNFLDTHETVPLYEQIWDRLNYGGIVHDIGIVAHRGVWVQESYVSTEVSGEGRPVTLRYRALLNSGEVSSLPGDTTGGGSSFGRTAVNHMIEVLDPVTGLVLAASETQRVEVESDRLREVKISMTLPGMRLWSPEAPNLYVLRQRTSRGGVVLDEHIQHIGFRSVGMRESGLQVNGKSLFLKAVSYMEDSPRHGRSLSLDEMERDVLMMKNLGINAVRLVSGSTHPVFLSLCDRYGILVFHDLPLRSAPDALLSKVGIHTSAKNVLRELIARDYNHASMAGVGFAQSVLDDSPVLHEFLKDLHDAAPQVDRMLRYVSFASTLPAELPPYCDFVGLDVEPQSTAVVSSLLATLAERRGDMPVVVSSMMYPVQIQNYNGYSDPRSIDAQGQFFLQLYSDIRDLGYQGLIVHSFTDWAVARPIMAVDRVHQYTATSGVVDRFRQKRIAYDVLKTSFNNEKPPVLVTGNHEEEHPMSFVVLGILIIFIFAAVYNLFRRFRENVVRSFLRPYNFFADVRDQRMLSLFQTSMVGLLGSLTASLLFANILYYWRMNILVEKVLSQFVHTTWLKQWLNYAAWNPLENTLVLTVLLFVLLLLFTLLLRLTAWITRKKVFLFDAFSVSMWSVLPIIILAPFGMVLYRVLDLPMLEAVAIIVYIVFHAWIISRILKGTAIVFDVRPLFFYIGGYTLMLAGMTAWLLSLNGEYEIFAYLRYYVDLWWQIAQNVS